MILFLFRNAPVLLCIGDFAVRVKAVRAALSVNSCPHIAGSKTKTPPTDSHFLNNICFEGDSMSVSPFFLPLLMLIRPQIPFFFAEIFVALFALLSTLRPSLIQNFQNHSRSQDGLPLLTDDAFCHFQFALSPH